MDYWRQQAGGDTEPAPENPDAAYYKRRAAMQALQNINARRN